MKELIDLPLCPYCKNTGAHMCDEIALPVLVRCAHKNCPITKLLDSRDELRAALKFYANRDNYDREGQLAHYKWAGEPHLSELQDFWVDYGFTAREALEADEERWK